MLIFPLSLFFVVLATKFIGISEIVCGRTTFNLKARVINLWSVPDKLNPAHEGSIQMVLMDEKVCSFLTIYAPHSAVCFRSNFIVFYCMCSSLCFI